MLVVTVSVQSRASFCHLVRHPLRGQLQSYSKMWLLTLIIAAGRSPQDAPKSTRSSTRFLRHPYSRSPLGIWFLDKHASYCTCLISETTTSLDWSFHDLADFPCVRSFLIRYYVPVSGFSLFFPAPNREVLQSQGANASALLFPPNLVSVY